jgi:molybdopterin molybdotransferase
MLEADNVLRLECLDRHAEECSSAHNVVLHKVNVTAHTAAPRTPWLAGEAHAVHICPTYQDCKIRSVSRQNGEIHALEWQAARRVVIEAVRGLKHQPKTEDISLADAHGRVLAEPVLADRDYPALRRSLRDGFAVHSINAPGTLRIRGEVRAGQAEQAPLSEGEALEIMTGAPVPEGADAVVMVEHVTRLKDANGAPCIQLDRAAEAGQFINERGAEARNGSVLIPEHTLLDASHIATLAMTGQSRVRVHTKPRVAILATGDEIVEIDATPAPHQIRNSNSCMLAGLVSSCGGVPDVLRVARDTPDDLRSLL